MQLILNCSNLYPLYSFGTAFPGYVDDETFTSSDCPHFSMLLYIDVNKLNRHFLSEGLLYTRRFIIFQLIFEVFKISLNLKAIISLPPPPHRERVNPTLQGLLFLA